MGAINPVGLITTGINAVSAVNQLSGRSASAQARNTERQQQLALQQLQERQQLNQQQLEQDVALERERLAVQAEADEDERKRALRRAVARQRAQFGARGVSSEGGSAQAILLGLFDESEDELNERERLDNLRSTALGQRVAQQGSLNVLQRTQLQQRQDLDNQLNRFRFFQF